MTFTWDETDLSTDLAKVRDAIGDTDSDDPILSDERINALVSAYSNWKVAAVHACDRLIAHYARMATSRSAIGLSSSRSMVQHFSDLKVALARSASASVAPALTGDSLSEKEDLTGDTDAVQPHFGRDTFTNND